MPFKDKEKAKQYWKSYNSTWYQRNRDYVLEKMKKRRRELQDWFFAYKSTLCCSKCGETNPDCLDFHHVGDKSNAVSQLMAEIRNKEQILTEIKKCIVLCANCHRKLHNNNRYKSE